ncbi:tripartite tricarboxylate transporter substrate binding protein [Bacillus mangrovi]|uniref:Tripartite tricarboxylate transporter substrate binding protein n=1 Tax=Metabacillus mangrovi TaxID=1491830 RepID=A0A7X2S9B2_9BACI|nr:tripartite tricarboxylate transporter substrate-binding protein [Metabacillus mangrovi]MTH55687.1 tripartite tricarboxylate transporter substrate binding protein [Metabacillus mangrovi]
MKKMLAVLLCVSLLHGCRGAADEKMVQEKAVHLVIPADRGGGWDLMGRSLQPMLRKDEVRISNMPGGNGETGWKYVKSHPDRTITLNSSLIITNRILGKSEITFEDFTPLGILVSDWEAIAVPVNSPYTEAKKLLRDLKRNPESLKIGVEQSFGNDDQIAFVQAAKELKMNPASIRFRLHQSNEQLVQSLEKKDVDAASLSFSEAAALHQKGKLKILAVSSDRRLEGFENVPTWKEQGISIVFPHWRGIMGPEGMSEEEIQEWDKKLKTLSESKEWAAFLKENHLTGFYKNSTEASAFLAEQQLFYETVL